MGWDVCGRVAWIGFILSYALLLRVSGLFFKNTVGCTPSIVLDDRELSSIRVSACW